MSTPPTKPNLDELLARIKNLEPLPQVAVRVLELSQRSDVVPRELITALQGDAALTAKLLRLCNSAYYGFKRRIASLDEAGNLLGTSALVNLVMTGCAARYFHDCPAQDAERRARRWKRSVAQAIATQLLARCTHTADAGRAYTAALLQDIGELVLDGFGPAAAARVEAEMRAGMAQLDAEARVYGMHHAEVGARLAARWNFPEVLVDVLGHHHAPENATIDLPLASLVHLGAQVVEELEHAKDPNTGRRSFVAPTALAALGLDEAILVALHEPLERELEKARELVEAA